MLFYSFLAIFHSEDASKKTYGSVLTKVSFVTCVDSHFDSIDIYSKNTNEQTRTVIAAILIGRLDLWNIVMVLNVKSNEETPVMSIAENLNSIS